MTTRRAHSRLRMALCSAGVLVLLFAVQVRARTCLILPFENQTRNASLEWISESLVEGIADVLDSPNLHVATREERAAAFDQLGIPAASILSRATIIKLAEIMDAEFVVVGQYSSPETGQLQVSAQILELRTPRLSSRFAESGPLRDLLAIQERLGTALARALDDATAGALWAGAAPAARPRAALDAWESYIRGLLASSKQQQVKYFLEAARRDGSFTRPAFQLGRIYFQDRDYTPAVPWLVKVKPDESNFLEATFLLGICYFRQEEYGRAETAFKTVAEGVPLSEVYNNLGAVLSRRGRPGAGDNFRKAAENDPADADYQFNLGYWHFKTGQFPSAIRRLRQALERRPNDAEARAVLVKALERSGNAAEAARERELLARNPAAARLLGADDKALEGLERVKRNYDEVSFRQLQTTLETLAEERLSRLPAAIHAEAHLEGGRESFREQDDVAALAELAEAARLDPARAETHLLLARLHERNGRVEDAVREARAALSLQRSADAHLLLAKIYLEHGRLAEAKQQAQQALELEPANLAAQSVLKTVEMRTP